MTPEGNRQPGGANVPATQPKPALPASGGQVMAIIPKTVEEMFRLADAISRSGLAPNTLNNAQKVMVAIMAGAELGMPPWQATQSFAVIGNRATIWGDAIPALLWSKGFKIEETFENAAAGYPDDMTAVCVVTRPDGTKIRGEFSVADAKEANLWSKSGPWQTAKKRMLKMRARAFAARDGAADVLRGMQVQEEVADYVTDVTPGRGESRLPGRREAMLERMRANQHQETDTGFDAGHVAEELGGVDTVDTPAHDPETGEIVEDAEFEEAGSHLSGDPVDDIPQEDGEKAADPQSAPPAESGAETQASSQSPSPSDASTSQSPTASQDGGATSASPSEKTLADKAADYERRLRAATNTTKLTSIRGANVKLRERIEAEMPERMAELEELFNELYRGLEDRGAE